MKKFEKGQRVCHLPTGSFGTVHGPVHTGWGLCLSVIWDLDLLAPWIYLPEAQEILVFTDR